MACIFIICFLLFPVYANAQAWERADGPYGAFIQDAAAAPNGYLYILSESLHRSTDQGATWHRIALDIRIEGLESSIICAPNGALYLVTLGRVLRSGDAGLTWVEIRDQMIPTYLTVTPDNTIAVSTSDSVYVSSDEGATWSVTKPSEDYITRKITATADGSLFTFTNDSLTHSTDAGKSWRTTLVFPYPTVSYYVDVAATSSGTIVALLGDIFYRSTDRGLTWTSSLVLTYPAGLEATGGDTLFLVRTTGGISRSTDGGEHWVTYDSLSHDGEYITASFALGNDLFARTTEGVYRYNTINKSVVKNAARTGSFLVATAPSGKMYASARVGPMYRDFIWMRDITGGWVVRKTESYDRVSLLTVDSNDLLYSIIDGDLAHSTDGGVSWRSNVVFSGGNFSAAIAGDSIFVVSLSRLWCSPDTGMTLEFLTDPLLNGIVSVAITNGFLYAGGAAKFYRSPDGGQSWEEPPLPFILGSGDVQAMTCAGPRVIISVINTGIYFSNDYGMTWENHSEGIPPGTVNQLLLTPSGTVFAATLRGIFKYSATTQTWADAGEGIVLGNILSLALDDKGRVHVGTDGDGIYLSSETYGSWFKSSVPVAEHSSNVNIYPNPAAATITVNLGASIPRNYTISIYDVLGVCRSVSAGERTLNISALPNGQYFVRIIAGSTVATRLLTVAR